MLNTIVKLGKSESLALIDFIGLKCGFMLQNRCPPIQKYEVRGKQVVSDCVRNGY